MQYATLFAAALAAALAGCGGTPVDYHRADDMKPGPGMITGDSGEKVWRIDLGGKATPAAASSSCVAVEFERWKRSAAGSDEYREFQDWREWREWKRRNAR
jgi:hypothetical protein